MTGPGSPAQPAWGAVARATGIGRGTSVLDVGCGTGGFCRLAASLGARVHGIDADANRIVAARRSVPGGDFRVGRSEGLPFPQDAFDVVTGFNVFQYAQPVEQALTEARRVARPGGRVAICKWGPPGENAFFAFLGRLDPSRFALPDAPVADPVDRALVALAMDVVARGTVPTEITMAGDEQLAQAVASGGSAPATADGRAWLDAVRAAASPFRQAGGGYRFQNSLRYAVVAA
jgi:SAM-dependent methyltransferase